MDTVTLFKTRQQINEFLNNNPELRPIHDKLEELVEISVKKPRMSIPVQKAILNELRILKAHLILVRYS